LIADADSPGREAIVVRITRAKLEPGVLDRDPVDT